MCVIVYVVVIGSEEGYYILCQLWDDYDCVAGSNVYVKISDVVFVW